MSEMTFEKRPINVMKLDADLRAALPTFTGLSDAGELRLLFSAPPTSQQRAIAEQVVDAHDPNELTAEQAAARAAEERATGAVNRIRSIPAWARISDGDAQVWILTNLIEPIALGREQVQQGAAALETATTLAQVKPIVAGMLDMFGHMMDMMEKQNDVLMKTVLMTLAQRDALWPGLVDEDDA